MGCLLLVNYRPGSHRARRIGRPAFEARPARKNCRSDILNLDYDSDSGNDLCGTLGAGLWQLPERVPEPLAGGRERGAAALALPPVRTDASLVGEYAAGELARSACALPHLPCVDWMAVSAGRVDCGGAVGCGRVGHSQLDLLT